MRSDRYMQEMFQNLGISYELSDVWNENAEVVEDESNIADLIEQNRNEGWMKNELGDALEKYSSEGMARTFGEYIDCIDTETAVKHAREELDDEELAEEWGEKEDYEMVARLAIGGEIIGVYENDEDARDDFIEEHLSGGEGGHKELAKLFM